MDCFMGAGSEAYGGRRNVVGYSIGDISETHVEECSTLNSGGLFGSYGLFEGSHV